MDVRKTISLYCAMPEAGAPTEFIKEDFRKLKLQMAQVHDFDLNNNLSIKYIHLLRSGCLKPVTKTSTVDADAYSRMTISLFVLPTDKQKSRNDVDFCERGYHNLFCGGN